MNLLTRLANAQAASAWALSAVLLLLSTASLGQSYQSGKHVEPAYEGWRPNDDGTFSFMFGYMNENWLEQPDVEVGENNFFSPGDADRGQPTHFYLAVIALILKWLFRPIGATES
jgi:hypothetical protein